MGRSGEGEGAVGVRGGVAGSGEPGNCDTQSRRRVRWRQHGRGMDWVGGVVTCVPAPLTAKRVQSSSTGNKVHVLPLRRGQPLAEALDGLVVRLVLCELSREADGGRLHTKAAKILTHTANSAVALHGPVLMVRDALDMLRKDLSNLTLATREITTYEPYWSEERIYGEDLLVIVTRQRLQTKVPCGTQ